MNTFTWEVGEGTSPTIGLNATDIQFGDGYRDQIGEGMNADVHVWQLSGKFRLADMQAIDAFLRANRAKPFLWTPPGFPQKAFTCKSWSPIPIGAAWYDVSLEFVEFKVP